MPNETHHSLSGREYKFRPVPILMNLWVYGLLFLMSAAMGLIAPFWIVISKVVMRWKWKRAMRSYVWLYGRAWVLILTPFVRPTGINLDTITKTGPCILIINHHSFFDTFFMGLLPVDDVNLTLRAWPFKMIWYRYFMQLARYLNLETLPYTEICERCTEEFSDNSYVLFFPEGHRSRDGQLQRFKSGAFKVAMDTNTPIIPLCISGTNVLLPPKQSWLMPCRVTLKALDPVFPADFRSEDIPHVAMRKAVRSSMQQELAEVSDV